jgi:transposase
MVTKQQKLEWEAQLAQALELGWESAIKTYLKRMPYGADALGKKLGVSRETVYRWVNEGVPTEHILDLERATGIPRHIARPELFKGYTRT